MLKLEQILHWILILWYPEFGNFVITFINWTVFLSLAYRWRKTVLGIRVWFKVDYCSLLWLTMVLCTTSYLNNVWGHHLSLMKQCYTYDNICVATIEYIMLKFKTSSVLSNNAAHTVTCTCEGDLILACGKPLHPHGTRVIQWVSHVEQELSTLPEYLSSALVLVINL